MSQAVADPEVFRGEGRNENRHILASLGLGRGGVTEVKRGSEPVPSSNHWQGEGGSLPDHPECDKITVVARRCFSGEITWRSSRLGINHRHLISGNTTCQHRQTGRSMSNFSLHQYRVKQEGRENISTNHKGMLFFKLS